MGGKNRFQPQTEGQVRTVLFNGWIIRELSMLDAMYDGVHPEAVHTLVQPEMEHIMHSLNHFGITPIEVRLLS